MINILNILDLPNLKENTPLGNIWGRCGICEQWVQECCWVVYPYYYHRYLKEFSNIYVIIIIIIKSPFHYLCYYYYLGNIVIPYSKHLGVQLDSVLSMDYQISNMHK